MKNVNGPKQDSERSMRVISLSFHFLCMDAKAKHNFSQECAKIVTKLEQLHRLSWTSYCDLIHQQHHNTVIFVSMCLSFSFFSGRSHYVTHFLRHRYCPSGT